MSTLEQKKNEYEEVQSVRFITNTLLEISAERIKALRERFDKNQIFYREIRDLYALVRWHALKRGGEGVVDTREHSVSLALTSNSRFYGSINSAVMENFIRHMDVSPERSFILVGNVGGRIISGTRYEKRCVYWTFNSDDPTENELQKLLEELKKYREVLVFHPQFVNVFYQDVGILSLTESDEIGDRSEKTLEYIFEPELPRIVRFFETRVRHLLLSRAMLESELARTAARLVTMNRADERAAHLMRELLSAVRKEEQTLDSLRLIESLAGIGKWKTSRQELSLSAVYVPYAGK
jgi:ATP synthase F1 gamma subunit